MKVRFLKNGAGFGFAYTAGAETTLKTTTENSENIKAMIETGVVEVLAEKKTEKLETRSKKSSKGFKK